MEGEVRKRTTLFVRNIPYSSTDNDLEELFSDYGPIKHCFVVRNRGIFGILQDLPTRA